MRDLIIAVMAWIAEHERPSERMKAPIAQRKNDGKAIGRGHTPDSKPRKLRVRGGLGRWRRAP